MTEEKKDLTNDVYRVIKDSPFKISDGTLTFPDLNAATAYFGRRLFESSSVMSTNESNFDKYKNELGGEVVQQFFKITDPTKVIGTYDNHAPHRWWMMGELLSEFLNLDPPLMYRYRPELFDQHYSLLPDGRMQYHYGNRWVEFGQMTNIHKKLEDNINSKRAAIAIYTPYDTSPDRRDSPCTLGYSFLHRDGKLNMTTMLRSWDFFGGFKTYDIALSSFVQQSMSSWLGVEPGDLAFYVTSLHYYNRDRERLGLLVDESQHSRRRSGTLKLDGDLDITSFYQGLRQVKASEDAAYNGNLQRAGSIRDGLSSNFMKEMCDVFIKKNYTTDR